VKFRYDPTTGALAFDASVTGLPAAQVIAVTLQRSQDGAPGPVIGQLVATGRTAAASSLVLRPRDRDDLLAGRLFVQLYTRQAPLGVGRAALILAAAQPSARR
jgi:hypothetical protein